ncbi:MAG: ABC transporter permease, partial [Planctomycetes bacterium]|nr:ABC transporter permease [Planctomycetota bacterium]
FYLFTIEHLRQFATLKALGLNNRRIIGMILLQAASVGSIGYGIGVGMAAVFGRAVQNASKLAFFMPWQVLVGTGIAVLLIVLGSSLLSIRRVLVLEPAMVFK